MNRERMYRLVKEFEAVKHALKVLNVYPRTRANDEAIERLESHLDHIDCEIGGEFMAMPLEDRMKS